ncbi:tyrosine-type recombinase/integrase [Phytohabitans aurantiacus]|uniref:Tyrosine recombinase XerD n=1 Tax=Phytohabitans aurantiacus TaxID=3016789 RepID=A0ABQ5R887_9ACTN|nr:tyrosine-type recombinase/integrase [Phytohabitans aurantiacus]GLI02986.1 tyrosine recombinase XerD [Phytohabitans aurantiacus]
MASPLTLATDTADPDGRIVEPRKLTRDLPHGWATLIRDWDRTLRAGNYSPATRYNYLLAVAQLARYLNTGDDVPEAAAVRRAQVESFQAWMIETRSAATALNKHKALQQFFRWLAEDGEIERSPMEHVRQPKTPQPMIPIIHSDDTRRLLDVCRDRDFTSLRDKAIMRLLANTGARLSEVALLHIDDLDMDRDIVRYHGKGAKDRQVRFGPTTGRALSKYLRIRDRHRHAGSTRRLWLAVRGDRPLSANGIKLMLRRRGLAAGVAHVHAHRWRHTFAHEWKLAGGDTGDLMLLLGWASEEMARRYGASAAAERAQQIHARLKVGEHG